MEGCKFILYPSILAGTFSAYKHCLCACILFLRRFTSPSSVSSMSWNASLFLRRFWIHNSCKTSQCVDSNGHKKHNFFWELKGQLWDQSMSHTACRTFPIHHGVSSTLQAPYTIDIEAWHALPPSLPFSLPPPHSLLAHHLSHPLAHPDPHPFPALHIATVLLCLRCPGRVVPAGVHSLPLDAV